MAASSYHRTPVFWMVGRGKHVSPTSARVCDDLATLCVECPSGRCRGNKQCSLRLECSTMLGQEAEGRSPRERRLEVLTCHDTQEVSPTQVGRLALDLLVVAGIELQQAHAVQCLLARFELTAT